MLMELEIKKKSEVLVLKDGKFVCFDKIDILFQKSLFIECSTYFGFGLFFSFVIPHFNLSPITTKK
jgi:hypothetical protein